LDKNEFRYPRNLIATVIRKKSNNSFINNADFNKLEGLFDSGDTSRTGNYTKNLFKKLHSIIKRI
jgi:hypothetical protein